MDYNNLSNIIGNNQLVGHFQVKKKKKNVLIPVVATGSIRVNLLKTTSLPGGTGY